ncbi:PASTA domain-containing protein, partial [Sulfurovum sp. bin170]|uniref:PASTA domain-containing protein n=1 Tax=Sulfurovum sp. bin170 TaxID=2695268 RepID=UPI0013DEB13B
QLKLGEVNTRADSSPEGTVISQTPIVGTEVEIGSMVSIVVSIPEKMTIVPDFIDGNIKDIEEIRNELRERNLQLGDIIYRFSDKAKGTIIEQNPEAGSKVVIRSIVNLTVAKASFVFDDDYRPPIGEHPIVIDEPTFIPRPPMDLTPVIDDHHTPIREIHGIGSVYEGRLDNSGITTVENLATADATHVAEVLRTNETTALRMITDAQIIRRR